MDKLNKKLIISLNNDIDGLGSVILARLVFGREVDYQLVNNKIELEAYVRKLIENSSIYQREQVFITGLPLIEPSYDIASTCPYLSNNLKVFDHHQSTIDAGLDNLSFVTARVNYNGRATCSTELFYNYLLENDFLTRTKALDDFVELTRMVENWDYKEDTELNKKASDLNKLFKALAYPVSYVALIGDKIKNNPDNFEFDELEQRIINSVEPKQIVEVARNGSKLRLVRTSVA